MAPLPGNYTAEHWVAPLVGASFRPVLVQTRHQVPIHRHLRRHCTKVLLDLLVFVGLRDGDLPLRT